MGESFGCIRGELAEERDHSTPYRFLPEPPIHCHITASNASITRIDYNVTRDNAYLTSCNHLRTPHSVLSTNPVIAFIFGELTRSTRMRSNI
jgi:hypothetical protein